VAIGVGTDGHSAVTTGPLRHSVEPGRDDRIVVDYGQRAPLRSERLHHARDLHRAVHDDRPGIRPERTSGRALTSWPWASRSPREPWPAAHRASDPAHPGRRSPQPPL